METLASPGLWIGFLAFVAGMLALDLGVFNRKAHTVHRKEALGWSLVWIALALVFNAGIWWKFGRDPALEFFSGYLLEKSLSIDNLFVFIVIFGAFRVPKQLQHRVLFWGIVAALGMRAAMILGGTALLDRFEWLVYVFGATLVITGVKLFFGKESGVSGEGFMMRMVRKVIPATDQFHGQHFLARVNGRRVATPLLLSLVLVEISDVVFALDSVPAVFAVTRDPFIVFTSNVFAILGLRSLFFLLADVLERLAYLKVGLAGVLVFAGVKLGLGQHLHLPPLVSLGIIATILGSAALVSIVKARSTGDQGHGTPAQ
jgi:tellurite resistance protein TerC